MAFRLLPKAEADLAEIVAFIAANSPPAAENWLEVMLDHCRRLGAMPGIGVARDDVRPGLRFLPAGNCLILYRVAGDDAEIVRIVHGARQWAELLQGGQSSTTRQRSPRPGP